MSKKGKFYILNWVFSYGSASSNRLLAYANSAAEQGYKVDIVVSKDGVEELPSEGRSHNQRAKTL